MSHTPHSPHLQARPQLVKQMVSVHNSQALATGGLNATGATPLMYHGFLKCWRGLFSSQRAKLSERVEHLNGGLSKLREATAEVDKLSKTANEQRAMLTVKQEEADRAMENIQKAMEAAVSNRSEVETLQKKLATEEVKMADRKKQVENGTRLGHSGRLTHAGTPTAPTPLTPLLPPLLYRWRRSSPRCSPSSRRRAPRSAGSSRTISTRSNLSRCHPSRSATC